MNKAKINVEALRSMHLFGDICEQAVLSAASDTVELKPLREAGDSIGRHWYGMRLSCISKLTGQCFYLHTGLIFLPETRVGLMVEVDCKNNLASYRTIWDKIQSAPEFEINRDEPEYLKLFMPDADFAAMRGMCRLEQAEKLAGYIIACSEAIAAAAYTEGFCLDYDDLGDAYKLALCFEAALRAVKSSLYTVEINYADPDNFSQYASGYRYWLKNTDGNVKLYAYFGGIYSYKKSPAGIFAEIDWFSNRQVFDKTFENMVENEQYLFSRKEPKFIKLFFTPERERAFNGADFQGQLDILTEFLDICNTQLILAATK